MATFPRPRPISRASAPCSPRIAWRRPGLEREPQVAAEILLAQGKDAEAFPAFRAYAQQHSVQAAKRFNIGVRQLTDELRGQLETARRDAHLQRQAAPHRAGWWPSWRSSCFAAARC